jgi:hypothetical protein
MLGRASWIDAVGNRPGSMAVKTYEANIWKRERRVAEVILKAIKPQSPPRVSLPTRSNRQPLSRMSSWLGSQYHTYQVRNQEKSHKFHVAPSGNTFLPITGIG